MAPIVDKPVTPESRPSVSRPISAGYVDKRSDLITKVRYTNTLPDIPFDPKFITYPFDPNRFVTYQTTQLEKTFKYDILTEPDLGVEVELVVPSAYFIPSNAPPPVLDPKDEVLLEEEIQQKKNQNRSVFHSRSVSWLRRTEYISTEQTRFQPQAIEKVEAKVGYSIKKKLKDEWHYSDRDSQVKAIEATFKDSLKPIEKHFAKPNVVPLEVLPVFPDFKLWKYPCAQVIFDSDPAPSGLTAPAQIEEMSQAMIRGVMDESGEQFVAYFLPTPQTLEKRKEDLEAGREYKEDEVYEYRMAREYNWNVKSKATKGYEENYFFVIRDEGVYYNELETRVRLNKRRNRNQNAQINTKLCVKHVMLAAADYKFQRNREKELEPLAEEEEEEEKKEKSSGESSGDESEGNKSKSGDEKQKKEDDDDKGKRSGKSSSSSSASNSGNESDNSSVKSAKKTTPKKEKESPPKLISDDEGSSSSSSAASSKKVGSSSRVSNKSESSAASDSD